MAVRPNLVVGAFGAVVFLVTATIIVQNWRDLTDTRDFVVEVDERTTPLGQRSSSMGAASTRTETYNVEAANVTRVTMRLTWQESSLTGAQHTVSLTLADPQGQSVGKASGRGGVAGITIEQEIAETPSGGRFTTREENAQDEFQAEYPERTESVGTWTATIRTDQPSQPGAAGITYTLSFEVEHFVASFREAPPLQR